MSRVEKTSRSAVGILSDNDVEATIKSVRSALEWSEGANIVLVHNGSTDADCLMLKQLFPAIHHVWVRENRGVTAGINALFSAIGWLDESTRDFRGRVTEQPKLFDYESPWDWVLFLSEGSEIMTLGGEPTNPGLYAPKVWKTKKLRNVPSDSPGWVDTIDSWGALYSPSHKKIVHLREKNVLNYGGKSESERFMFIVPGSAFWVHRRTINVVGAWDESLHTYYEDVDFSMRAILAGVKLGRVTDTEIRHGLSQADQENQFHTQVLYTKNRDEIARRYQWLEQSVKPGASNERPMGRS